MFLIRGNLSSSLEIAFLVYVYVWEGWGGMGWLEAAAWKLVSTFLVGRLGRPCIQSELKTRPLKSQRLCLEKGPERGNFTTLRLQLPAFSGRGAGHQRIAHSLPALTQAPTWIRSFAIFPASTCCPGAGKNPRMLGPFHSRWKLSLSSLFSLTIVLRVLPLLSYYPLSASLSRSHLQLQFLFHCQLLPSTKNLF